VEDTASASQYLHGHHDSVLRSHRWRTVENSAAYLAEYLRPGTDVLDVGCGPGTITVDIGRRVSPGRVIAIDPSAEVLGEAQLASSDVPTVSFHRADVLSLPFRAETFDIVHAHQVLQHLSDPVAALLEMARVCRPEGMIAVRDGDYGAMSWYPDSPALSRWLDLYRRAARAIGGEPDAGRRLGTWVHQAGLAPLALSASTWCFIDADDRAWWAELWAERTAASPLASRITSLGLASQAELEEIASGWSAWAQAETGWFCIVHGEVLCQPNSGLLTN
jgi:SAM-dependent methyltransferase